MPDGSPERLAHQCQQEGSSDACRSRPRPQTWVLASRARRDDHLLPRPPRGGGYDDLLEADEETAERVQTLLPCGSSADADLASSASPERALIDGVTTMSRLTVEYARARAELLERP